MQFVFVYIVPGKFDSITVHDGFDHIVFLIGYKGDSDYGNPMIYCLLSAQQTPVR